MEIAIFAFMENEVKEYYDRLLDACRDDVPLEVAYRQLRELLEQLCRTQMSDGSLQMTDLSARISYVAAKVGLSVVEQNRLHTFRLTSQSCAQSRRGACARQSVARREDAGFLRQAPDARGYPRRPLPPPATRRRHLRGDARGTPREAHARVLSIR